MENPERIVITGASSGIGRALALAYAAPGVRLLLAGRDAQRLAEVSEACRARGATAETLAIPVTARAELAAALQAWDDKNATDLVIANAGMSGGPAADPNVPVEPPELFRRLLDVNLGGTLNTVEPLLPRLVARKKGQLALMSSLAGFRGMPNAPAYSTAKMAVRAYGEALRPLLKPTGVTVSVIFPGFVRTPLTAVNRFPMPFLMEPEEAAKRIKKGLARGGARIAFPWPTYLAARAIAALPLFLSDFVLSKAPKKA
jgi:short-subunit dehydrogenase